MDGVGPSSADFASSPSPDYVYQLNFPSAPSQPSEFQLFIYGFILILIPTATILGNVLVIVSVLRFKSLQSAINFLILGLAIADLMVALFVMPYAVYVYVQGGRWLIGPLMCNLYLSSDVACSTASIILLALISFDRYQAISHPIQYSRQAQNIARVVRLFVGVWVYSLLVASPIVLGFNDPPPEEISGDFEPFECRFYNPWFSLLSSFVSFLIPCCIVIFVYLRIIRALRKRERAAKARKHAATNSTAKLQTQAMDVSEKQQLTTSANQMESDEAGEIVAGPAINMMMIALPSFNRQMRRYERHRRALEEAALEEDDELSSTESLSDDIRIQANDFFSEVLTSNSKASASLDHFGCYPSATMFNGFRASFSGVMDSRKKSMAEEIVPSIFTPRKRSACDFGTFGSSKTVLRQNTSPIQIRVSSVRDASRERPATETASRSQLLSPCVERVAWAATTLRQNAQVPNSNEKGKAQPQKQQRHWQQHAPASRGTLSFPLVKRIAIGREIRVNHYLLNDGEDTTDLIVPEGRATRMDSSRNGHIQLGGTTEKQPQKERNGGSKMHNGAVLDSASFRCPSLTVPSVPPFRRGTSSIELSRAKANDKEADAEDGPQAMTTKATVGRAIKEELQKENTTNTVISADDTVTKSAQMPTQQKMPLASTVGHGTEKSPRRGTTMASEQNSRRDRQASLRRKVHKSQRKEKRATKTLGIVVGTFLCCWVPFFSLNIANALCIETGFAWCQIGFGPFFYSTWLGYMNSFMNPLIYTIFNAEFRRAFKSLLLGRRRTVFARQI